MSYLDKFDREVEKFCIKNHQAKKEMKKKLMNSGRNQMGHFVAGKPVREVYERFSVRDDFIKKGPGGNVSILDKPYNEYFTQIYPLPITLADLALPSEAQKVSLERLRRSKEMQEVRPAELGFTGMPGRPRQIELELPPDVVLRQQFSRGGILLEPGTISRGASAASATTLSGASTSFAM